MSDSSSHFPPLQNPCPRAAGKVARCERHLDQFARADRLSCPCFIFSRAAENNYNTPVMSHLSQYRTSRSLVGMAGRGQLVQVGTGSKIGSPADMRQEKVASNEATS